MWATSDEYEGDAKAALEAGDAAGDVALALADGPGGGGDRAEIDDGAEGPELADRGAPCFRFGNLTFYLEWIVSSPATA